MSHYILTIKAEGPHHTNEPNDAYPKALEFAKQLGAMGHKIALVDFSEDKKAAEAAAAKGAADKAAEE